ncbi:hypothetical protein [Sphingomonas bacterium]|uniref:hypothetical protein n=1 Tax=Sphingomonas bacterium TaxID=1895847 RepID=UPI002613DAE2|nr:hypothetical protein [Sphingomonas bacterium]MDB5678503.1 hypothetical protein [Sphingomonas bacterium]
MKRVSHWLGAASILVLSGLAATPASASGVTAGSTITNTVTVNYNVGTVAQTAISASDTFTVDRKVNVTVTEVGSTTTSVSPGQLAAVEAFTVTNLSNATLDLALTAAQQTGGAGAHSNTDNFDVTNVRIYVDTNGNGSYDAGDTLVTYLDELGADASKTVFIVSDIPLGRATGDVAAVTLTATGREAGTSGSMGIALVQTAGANTSGMDTVFADGAGATDAARDAAFSAKGDYTVLAAALTVTKVSSVISDPFNGTTNPKMIPGSVVQYCITVKNAAGGASASGVAISDLLPTTTTYQSAFGILLNGTVTGTTCNLDGTAGGAYASGTVSATIPTVVAGDSRTVVFRVTVN